MKVVPPSYIAALGLVILTLGVATAQAQFDYVIYNGTITITGGCPSSPGAVIIPESINGKPVTSIGWGAFS